VPAFAANSIAVNPGYWAPVTVTGNGWFYGGEPSAEWLPVKVTIIDSATREIVAVHQTTASAARCNNRNMCFGGGTFSTQFSVPEIGTHRHEVCAELEAVAEAETLPTAIVKFWLPSCLN